MIETESGIFHPFLLRSTPLKNRIVMAPMTRQKSPGGVPGPDVAAYYRRRAEGGVGLIVTEGIGIDHPAAVDHPSIPVLYGDAALDGWRGVVEAVHTAGGLIVPQLWHQGGLRDPAQSPRPDIAGLRPSGYWGTPGVTSLNADYIERMRASSPPATEEDLADVIASYGRAARNAIAVGFDGIAIHGAHGYLIDTFLWPDTNRRPDRFGGGPRARAAFGAEIVREIRGAVGGGIPIIFRFSQHKQQDYKARFAQSPDELGEILGVLSDAGVDLFDASTRRFDAPAFAGSDLTLSGWARHLTGKPSMTVGGIGLGEPSGLGQVQRLLDEGMFDLIAVGRAMIGDAAWAAKMRRGEAPRPFDPDYLRVLQ